MTPTTPQPRTATRAAAAILASMLAVAPAAAPVLLMMAPVAADARPGEGGSMGSRGSRTYSAPPVTRTNPGGASPFDRSLTPRSGYGQPGYNQGGYGQTGGYNRGFGGGLQPRSHPFAAGFAGGLIGAGIGGLLFGHGFFGGGGYGGYGDGGGGLGLGGLLGLIIQLAIVYFVARWLWRRFSGRRMGGPTMAGGGSQSPVRTGGMPTGNGSTLAISPADYGQFEQALRDVQQAWSMQDLHSLSRFATPEMVSYFSDQLADLSSRNLRNVVSDVRMEQGDLSEAWSENNREFATVAMRYSLIDVTTDLSGRVVDGSPNERQLVTELWTFVRARGGSWLLSAIQQAR